MYKYMYCLIMDVLLFKHSILPGIIETAYKCMPTFRFQNIDVFTFCLGKAQRWSQDHSLESTTTGYPDVLRRVKDEEYAAMIDIFSKKGVFPCNTVTGFWDPFHAVVENAPLLSRQAISWVSCDPEQGLYTAWGLSMQYPCAAGVTMQLSFYGTTTEQLTQHVFACIEHLGSGQSFTDPKLDVNFFIHYSEQLERFEGFELVERLDWKRVKLSSYKQNACFLDDKMGRRNSFSHL